MYRFFDHSEKNTHGTGVNTVRQHVGKHILQDKRKHSLANRLQDRRTPYQRKMVLQDNRPCTGLSAIMHDMQTAPIQRNNTGLPDNLKTGMETLSGMNLDHVKVHYNSSKPSAVQAHAYAQGSDIHLAAGQEKHLPHELGHIVQQAQGRVKPTTSVAGVDVNDNPGLETEATKMGEQALQRASAAGSYESGSVTKGCNNKMVAQRRIVKDGKEFSFLSIHSLNGNPYLASKNGNDDEQWKINEQQDNINLTKVDSMAIPFTDASQERIFHNINMNRQQLVKHGEQTALMDPFRSYAFKPDTRPEISVFNIGNTGKAERGMLYKDYKNEVTNTIQTDKTLWGVQNQGKMQSELNNIKEKMMPLIMAEEYRTTGSKDEFINQWGTMSNSTMEWAKKLNPESKNDKKPALGKLSGQINNATAKLPFAGTGGKKEFREKKKRKLNSGDPLHIYDFEEINQNVFDPTMSPRPKPLTKFTKTEKNK